MSHGGICASLLLHGALLQHTMRSPLSFYDITPLGRVLNRFSKDIDTVDIILPQTLRGFLMCFMHVLQTVIVVAIATPQVFIVALPLGALYFVVQVDT